MTQNITDPLQAQHANLPTESPATQADIDYIFATMLLKPAFFLDARPELESGCFNLHTEAHFVALWEVMCDVWERYHNFVYSTVVNECHHRCNSHSIVILESMQNDLLLQGPGGFLYEVYYTTEPDDWDERYAAELLRKFLSERAVIAPLRNLLNQSQDGSYAADITDIIRQSVEKSRRITAVRGNPAIIPMPDRLTHQVVPVVYTPTNIEYVDRIIGGDRPGDANGLLGPYGSGKSTFARQMAVERAWYWHNQSLVNGGPSKITFFLSYEEPWEKFCHGIWAYAAKIDKKRLEQLENFDSLSDDNNLLEYEQRYYETMRRRGAGEHVTQDRILSGEKSRWDDARQWLNESLVIIDMSGSGSFPDAGSGGIEEMAATIERNLAARGRECGGVYIDYAKLVCKRFMSARDMADERMRHLIGDFGDNCRRHVSEYFNCSTWIVHQFSGEANKRSPTTALHHADAAEAKNFAENLAVCGCLGNKDKSTGCLLINFSKIRFDESTDPPPILKINGTFACLDDVSSQYSINVATKRFSSRSDDVATHGDVPQIVTRPGPGRVSAAAGIGGDMA